MSDAKLQALIEQAYEDRAKIGPQTTGDVRDAVERALACSTAARRGWRRKFPARPGRIRGRSTSG